MLCLLQKLCHHQTTRRWHLRAFYCFRVSIIFNCSSTSKIIRDISQTLFWSSDTSFLGIFFFFWKNHVHVCIHIDPSWSCLIEYACLPNIVMQLHRLLTRSFTAINRFRGRFEVSVSNGCNYEIAIWPCCNIKPYYNEPRGKSCDV